MTKTVIRVSENIGGPGTASVSHSTCDLTLNAAENSVSFKRGSAVCTCVLTKTFDSGTYKVSATLEGWDGGAQWCSNVFATGLTSFKPTSNSFTKTLESPDWFVKSQQWQFSFGHGCWMYGNLEVSNFHVDRLIIDTPYEEINVSSTELSGELKVGASLSSPFIFQVYSCYSFMCSIHNTSASTYLPDPPSVAVRGYDEDTLAVTIEPPLKDGGANVTHYEYTVHFFRRLAQWKLNYIDESMGTVVDSVQNYNGVASSNRPLVNADGSLRFTPSQNNKVTVPWSAALNPDAFSVTMWAKAFSSKSSFASLLSSRDNYVDANYQHTIDGYMVYNQNGRWQFWLGVHQLLADSGSVVLNAWQYIKISYRSGTMKLHVDGSVYTKTVNTFMQNQNSDCGFHIGAGACNGNSYLFDGDIKDVSFYSYDRTSDMISLTDSERHKQLSLTMNVNMRVNVDVRVDTKACTLLGCSPKTTNDNLPPCPPDSDVIDDTCWVFMCPSGQYHLSPTECQNMTNATCPYGAGIEVPSARRQSFQGATSDDGVCIPCIPGRYKNNSRAAACLSCPVGYYSKQSASSFCEACPKGFFGNTTSKLSCFGCPAGTFNDQIAYTTATTCTVCAPGTYQNATGSSICILCPPGRKLVVASTAQYHDALSDCEECGILQFNPFEGHAEECYLCLTAKTFGSSQCDGCSPGTLKVKMISEDGNKTDECNICPMGFFSEKVNSPVCDECPFGFFANHQSSQTGDIIYDRCQSCPRGTYGIATAATNVSSGCDNCTRGKYSDNEGLSNAEMCKECPKGKWSSDVGVTKESACVNCGTGKYGQNRTGANSEVSCRDCRRGSYLALVGSYGISSCLACPLGFVQNVTGQAFCLPCTPGSYSNESGMAECLKCASGRYSLDLARTIKCSVCLKGRYQSKQGSTSCLDCIPGQYQKQSAQVDCLKCAIGRASSVVAQDSECDVCKQGRYQSERGGTQCLDCLPGQILATTEGTNCTLCPQNTFAPHAKSIKCVLCSVGLYTSGEGAAVCIECSAGRYGEGCRECPEGWKTSEDDAVHNCVQCNLGMVSKKGSASCDGCDVGKYGSMKGFCSECQPGRYQDGKGLSQCKPCPINTFFSGAGATALSQCESCPDDRATGAINGSTTNTSCLCLANKYYQDSTLSVACTLCPNGGVCPKLGSVAADLYAQPGYWQPLKGVPEFLSCADAHRDIKLAQLAAERCCPTSANCSKQNAIPELEWTTDHQCMQGYAGPLCLACAKNYVLFDNDCIPCKGGSPFTLGLASLSAIALLLYLVMLLVLSKTKKAVEIVQETRSSRVAGLVSIIVSWLQILSALTVTYKLAWPKDFATYSKGTGTLVNLEMFSFLAISSCSLSVPFADRFLLQMLTPPFFSFAVFAAWLTMRSRGSKEIEIAKARSWHSQKIVMLLIQLMYPKLATRIFQVFRCQEVRHIGLVLGQDFSLKCWEGKHTFYAAIAFICSFVYLIGVPLCTFAVLYYYRHRLHTASVEQRFGDLYRPYEAGWPYWEVALQSQKCILTGAMCTIQPGSPLQLLAALLCCLAYMLLVLHAGPCK